MLLLSVGGVDAAKPRVRTSAYVLSCPRHFEERKGGNAYPVAPHVGRRHSPTRAFLLLLPTHTTPHLHKQPYRRLEELTTMSFEPTAEDVENWKAIVDPKTCALKQYSMSLTLTTVSLVGPESCIATDGSVSPYVQFSIGGKTVRSKTEVNTRNPVYLETFQLGCQDITTPLEVSVVNGDNGKTCMKTEVEHWTYGRKGVFTSTQPAESDKARSGGFGIIKDTQQSYPYTIKSGLSSLDLTINAFPGPQDEASKWNVHTPGDIFGIVAGMMAFCALIGYFIWKLRNSASGPAMPEPAAADAAAGASAPVAEKKLGGATKPTVGA